MNRTSEPRWEGRTAREWLARLPLPAVRIFDTLRSTNDVAREWADAGAPAGALVLADAQSAGRGRGGRAWWSPAGVGLYASVVLRPERAVAGDVDAGVVSLRVGLALAGALRSAYGLDARVKWPNDLLAPRGGKLAGVLCESALAGSNPAYVVAGMGVNVGHPDALPPELRDSATSVAAVLGHAVERAALLAPLAAELAALAAAPVAPLSAEELARVGRLDALAGRLVRVDRGPPVRARGVDPSGALRVASLVGGGETLVRTGTVRIADTRREAGVGECHDGSET